MRIKMLDQKLVPAVLGALLMALPAGPSQAAAPVGDLRLGHGAEPLLHAIAERRCTQRRGARHCRTVEQKRAPAAVQEGYGYAYGVPRAEFYPTGSSQWWQAMEREGRTGKSPD